MNRLTHYNEARERYEIVNDYGDVMIDNLNYAHGPAVDCLAAYEDTGLTPEICAEYKKFEDEAIGNGVTFNRIVELMNAEAEGRLTVLPCRVGDSVFTVQRSSVSEYRITGFLIDGKSVFAKWELIDGFYGAFRIDGVPASRIWYDIFQTREEAEDALRRAGG